MPHRNYDLGSIFGAGRLTQTARHDVVMYLAASAYTDEVRRRLYRLWCARVGLGVSKEDLHDVAPPRRRSKQRPIVW